MPAAVPTDEIYERYLQRAIAEINELGDELARAGDEPASPSSARSSPRGRLPPEVHAAGDGDPGGSGLLRPLRPGRPEVAPAAPRGPARGLRHELPQVRHRGPRGCRRLVDARAAHRPAEARGRHGCTLVRIPERPRFPLADAIADANEGVLQRFTPTIQALTTPDVDESLDDAAAKTRFWNAFKALGPWWAEQSPF